MKYILLLVLLSGSLFAQTPELGLPVGHTKAVTSVAFSPDGRYVLTGSLDKLVKLWDMEGRVLRTLDAGGGGITGVGFSPRGRYLYGQYRDTTVLWDLNGRIMLRCNFTPEFSPDESKLLYVSGDTLWLQQMERGARQMIATAPQDNRNFFYVAKFSVGQFSPDGRYFVRIPAGKLECWTAAGKRLWQVPLPQMEASAVFSPDQQCIAVALADGTLRWYNLKGSEINRIGTPSQSETMISCIGSAMAYPLSWARIGFSGNGKKMFCSTPGYAAVYAIAGSGSSKDWLQPDYELSSEAAAGDGFTQNSPGAYGHILQLSQDGNRVLWRKSVNSEADVMNRAAQSEMMLQGLYGPNCNKEIISNLAYRPANTVFDPEGQSVFTGYADGSAVLCDLNGKVIRRFQSGYALRTTALANPADDGVLLLTQEEASWDEVRGRGTVIEMVMRFNLRTTQIKIYDPAGMDTAWANNAAVRRYFNQMNLPKNRFLSYDGRYILEGEENPNVRSAGLLNSGLILSATTGTVRIFEQDRLAVQFWDEMKGSVSDVALSPDGKYLLTSPTYVRPRVWDFQCLLDPSIPVVEDTVWGRAVGLYLDTLGSSKCLVGQLAQAPERSYFLNFSEDSQSLLLKDRETIYRVGLDGKILQTYRGHRQDVSGACFLQDNHFVLSWAEDYTTRLWDAATGEELAVILFLPGNEWVVTTPQGLFDASPGAMEMMYYVIGIEPVEIDQIKERYYEPGLLQKLLGYHNEPVRQVEQFDAVELYPAVELRLDTARNSLTIQLKPRNGGIGKVSVFVNGKEIIEDANPPKGAEKLRDTTITIDLETYARYFLVDSLNSISVRAYNQAGWLKSAPKHTNFFSVPVRAKGEGPRSGAAPSGLRRNPNLFILAVGTHDYAGKDLDLKFAGKDAKNMIYALQQIGRPLFMPDKVFVQLLTTDTSDTRLHPTKTNIQAAFDSIRAHARAEDMVLVYFSGHGIAYGDADRAQFYYLTQDIGSFDLSDVGVRDKRTVSSAELTRWLKEIAAQKQVLIMDACNSGKLVENLAAGQKSLSASQIRAFDRMKDRTGMFVLTGSAADKVSYEASQFGQGLLTYSLLEGIKGEVPDKFGLVDVMALFRYACERVPELARGIGGIQTPVPAGPLGKSFSIGIADSTVSIPLAEEKAVFIRNVFQDEERFDDALGLTKLLEDYLVDQTVTGDASFIYVDVAEYDDAYSIKGLYKIQGDEVQVRARLYKGKTPLGEAFSVKGKKSQLSILVENIVEQAAGLME